MTVHTIKLDTNAKPGEPESDMRDIAAMARRFADDVEAGKYRDLSTVALVAESGIDVYLLSWGAVGSRADVLRLLSRGQHRLS